MQVYEVRISTCGTQEWYQNGKLNRIDGPAIVWADGDQVWYQNGQLSRLDGPAVVCMDGSLEWYINGVQLTEEEFNQRIAPKPSCDDKTVTIDGVEYTLVLK